MVEGTPLLRVQARKGLEGSNPFVSATYPSESVPPSGCGRIFPLFSGVMREGLSTGSVAEWP